jgi:hypothetical protein
MIEGKALQRKGNEGIDPRWLDATPGAVCLLSLEDPLRGAAKGGSTDEAHRPAFVEVQQPVEQLEPAWPRRDRQARRR